MRAIDWREPSGVRDALALVLAGAIIFVGPPVIGLPASDVPTLTALSIVYLASAGAIVLLLSKKASVNMALFVDVIAAWGGVQIAEYAQAFYSGLSLQAFWAGINTALWNFFVQFVVAIFAVTAAFYVSRRLKD